MKKIITLITMSVLSLLTLTTVYATDYVAQLSELKGLVAECDSKGIHVPYEKVGISTFERFIGYLAEDEQEGVSSDIMTYNYSALDSMYSRTKTNLQAYLNGTKTPLWVPVYNMMNTSVSGMKITDGQNNVISTGYGVFDTVEKDIENLHSFGMVNMQMETGPKDIIALPDWNYRSAGSPEYYFDVVQDGADRALKIVFSSEQEEGRYFRFSQNVAVMPYTTYYYKMSYKGSNVDSDSLSIQINNGKTANFVISSVTNAWTDTGWKSFTTGANVTSVTLGVYISDKCDELLIDDIILAKQIDGANLLTNGDFENSYSVKNVSAIQKKLERAKNSNISVSFLLQPKYFWRIPGCSSMYATTTTTTEFNINDERAKAKIEAYLGVIVPILDECDAVRDICLTNEPSFDTRAYPNTYNRKFRDYLTDKYDNLRTINKNYGTSYQELTDIEMPTEFSKTAFYYDWIEFNENQLTEWNEWIASIVKDYTSKPVHCKIMNYMAMNETQNRDELTHGADAEKFAAFCDYAGNDASNSTRSNVASSLITKMMWYDYLYSVVEKPIYNSEDHFITNGDTDYSTEKKNIVRCNLWQGAVHGRAMSTMWVWERTYDSDSSLACSILTRPDCVEEAGYTSLDMMRSADDITKLSSKAPEVALFYSKTSRVFNDDYSTNLRRYYQALLLSGKRVGFVTETSLNNLSNYSYLVIPSVTYTTPEALSAVNAFIDNGGKVIYYDTDCMSRDKFGNSMSNSKITSQGRRFSSNTVATVASAFQSYFSTDRVRIVDSGNANTTDVEYEYVISGNSLLVNMVYLGEGTKTVSVKFDGQKKSGLTNIITGETTGQNHTLTQYVPLTLKLKYSENTPSALQNLQYSNNMLYWRDDDNAASYSVYYTGDSGVEGLYSETANNYCAVSDYGVFRVVPKNSVGGTGTAATITVQAPIDIAFNSVSITNSGVIASVKVSNKLNIPQRAVIKIKTAEGKLAISDIWLPSMGEWDFKTSFDGTTNSVSASVSSDVNGEAISSVIYTK